ncbi:hypothetical protein QAD02_003516 [Eretmocerus hayati]|uniref:Uncharacterized protein n=1 Tax=Eretmocerus hayati TaxID=131215 RepID=A0ACC2NMB1_9HYME|nr:hypothetical protein QAD02_003516 [Eretmocerus hayati]
MLKLVRNKFALKGPIIYNGKHEISWEYVKNSNEVQLMEGLHGACKVENRHIYFHNEKMKVFLAAQTLSNKRVIRGYKHCLRQNDNIYQTLITETLKLLPPSVFLDDEHFFEQEFLSDHRYNLLHLVIKNYLDKRLNHENNILNDSKDRVRMLFNKLTIAKGQ